MNAEGIHGSLPWFVNGTLGPEEAAAFERHLADCQACRDEMAFLKKLRAELDRHGDAFLAEHPSAERIAALLDPACAEDEVPDDEATALRRHLALCATCAEESRWLRGEEMAGRDEPTPAEAAMPALGRAGYRRWAAAAALVVLAVLLGIWVRHASPGAGSRIILPHLVAETRRAGGAATEVPVEPGADRIHLIFEVDLAEADFPAMLEIMGAGGESIHRDEVAAGDVHDGLYLFVDLRRRDFPDGSYLARLRGSREQTGSAAEYPFRVVSAAARR